MALQGAGENHAGLNALAGRMEIVRLHPLAQCELARSQPGFLDRLVGKGFPNQAYERLGSQLIARVVAGGYPGALAKDRGLLGQFLETFVFQELRRQASWHETATAFFHFRDKDGTEVDIVLERSINELAGVEVKAAATVSEADFRGRKKLQSATGDRFISPEPRQAGARRICRVANF